MKAVKFLKPWRHYNSGETAGFDDEQADKLVDGKVAEPAGDAKPTVADKPAGRKAAAAATPPATDATTPEGATDVTES